MYTIFDTETSGLPLKGQPPNAAGQPHIMQIGAQLLDSDFKLVNEFNLLVKLPPGLIPDPGALAVTGLSAELCNSTGVTPAQAHCTFSNFLQRSSHVIAHNLAFDSHVWSIFCARHGLKNLLPKLRPHCTMEHLTPILKIPSRYRGKFKWPSLAEAYAFVTKGGSFDGAHDALADVRAVTTIWKYINGV